MFPVVFKKARAQEIDRCIDEGTAIPPTTQDGWSMEDLMITAAVCRARVLNHMEEKLDPVVSHRNMHQEHQEAFYARILFDSLAAVEFMSTLVFEIWAGQYDQNHQEEVRCQVALEGDSVIRVYDDAGCFPVVDEED